MKFSVSSYSYSQLVSSGEYKEIELIRLAKEMGFDGIEFAEIHPSDGENKIEYAEKLRNEAESFDIEIVAYCIGSDLLNDTENEVRRMKEEVLVCEALGAGIMRHDASWGYKKETRQGRGFNNALPVIAGAYKEVTDFAKQHNVKTCIENHGFFCQDSMRVEAIINAVNDENFGALVDIGNFLCADENPVTAVGNVAPYALHVHCKDFHKKAGDTFIPPRGYFMTRGGNWLRGAIIGHGDVPVVQCLRILKNAGYNGYLTVEFEGMEEAKNGVKWGLETLKRIEEIL